MSFSYEGGVGLGQGKNPIAPSGNIHINAKLHARAIKTLQHRMALGRTALGGSPSIEHWDINHGDIVVSLESTAGYPDPLTGLRPDDTERAKMANHQDISYYVLGCLNGFGDRDDDRFLLTQKLRSAAVATGRVKAVDASGAVAVRVGGMATIANTGPHLIQEGDIVEVSAPDPKNPRAIGYSRSIPPGKIVPWTVPSHEMSISSLAAAYKMLQRNGIVSSDDRQNFPFAARYAQSLHSFTLRVAQTAVLSAVKIGIVSFNAGGASRLANPSFPAADLAGAKSFHTDLMTPGSTVGQFFFKSLLSQENKFDFFLPTATTAVGGVAKFDEPWKGEVVNDQRSAFSDFHAASVELELKRKRLVLGQAMSNAMPGSDFDVLLGPV